MRVKELVRSSRTPRAASPTVASFARVPNDDPTRDRDPGVPRSRYERIERRRVRLCATRSRPRSSRETPRARAFRIVFTSHAPLDRLGRLEGGNLAEHGGGGDGRHGDRLVTFLERTNGARRGRGREKERFVRVVDLSFKHACLVFFFISMYYVLQYEHNIHGSVFRTCGADRNARVTGSSTPGSAIEGGFTTGRIDRSMDRWMDGWMEFGHLGRARADKKRRESRPRARWRLRKRTANARRRRQKRDAK